MSQQAPALAQLYLTLENARAWLKHLSAFFEEKDQLRIENAVNNINKNIAAMLGFYQKAIQKPYLGDKAVYESPDVIIVLSCNSSDMLNLRLDCGMQLARQFPSAPVVLSGGGRTIRLDAHYMKRYMLDHGIPKNRLITEGDAVDTVGNAVFSALTLGMQNVDTHYNRVLVVTSDFHAPRSLYLFQQVLGADRSVAVAIARSSLSPESLLQRAHSEWTQEALAGETIFTLPVSIKQGKAQPQAVSGEFCSLLYQMFTEHALYKDRWDLGRKYLPRCSGKAVR